MQEAEAETVEEWHDGRPPDDLFPKWRGYYRQKESGGDVVLDDFGATMTPDALQPHTLVPSGLTQPCRAKAPKEVIWPIAGDCTGVFCEGECVCGEHLCKDCACEAGAPVFPPAWFYDRREPRAGALCQFCSAPATVATRWKTPMCERCWLIASQGQGINPRTYQPRPFGPIEGDEDEAEEVKER